MFFVQEDCLTAKERCISLARLVAMQLSLLSHNQQVINLERHEVTAFLEKHTSFQQVCYCRYTQSNSIAIYASWSYSMLMESLSYTSPVLYSLICTVQHNLHCTALSVHVHHATLSILYKLICTVQPHLYCTT